MGYKIKILFIPHLGEFDQAALFMKTLDYEAPVFEWLAANVPTKYDLIIEIGANIGAIPYSGHPDEAAGIETHQGNRVRTIARSVSAAARESKGQ